MRNKSQFKIRHVTILMILLIVGVSLMGSASSELCDQQSLANMRAICGIPPPEESSGVDIMPTMDSNAVGGGDCSCEGGEVALNDDEKIKLSTSSEECLLRKWICCEHNIGYACDGRVLSLMTPMILDSINTQKRLLTKITSLNLDQ